ncbi:MAG: hypothetical protein H8D23_21660 [Candidatus Brocadiales bacterium]|nr:hypothetical protein [Candidatus Brocadiales bacterium]
MKIECIKCRKKKPRVDFYGMTSYRFLMCKACRRKIKPPLIGIKKKFPDIDKWTKPNGWWECNAQHNRLAGEVNRRSEKEKATHR